VIATLRLSTQGTERSDRHPHYLGNACGGTWSQDYLDRVEADLMQTTLAAATEPDRQALRLLQQEFALLAEWAENVVGERQALKAARVRWSSAAPFPTIRVAIRLASKEL